MKVLSPTFSCHPTGGYAKWAFGGLRILEGVILACLLQKLPNSINKAYVLWGLLEPQH